LTQAFFNFDGDEGRRRRDEGMEQARANASAAWRRAFESAVLTLIHRKVLFTAEDVRAICGNPEGHPNAFSSMMNSVIRRGWIIWTGRFTPTTRASSHARGAGLKIYRAP
jgi:hypothetical protein